MYSVNTHTWSRAGATISFVGAALSCVATGELGIATGLVFLFEALALGAATAAYGRWKAKRSLRSILPVRAFQMLSGGSLLEEASELLDRVPRGAPRTDLVVGFQRSLIALYQHDAPRAERIATQTLEAASSFAHDSERDTLLSLIRSARALALIALHRVDAAEREAREVQSAPDAHPRAVAWAQLTRALVAANRGDLEATSARLDHLRSVGNGYFGTRERVLVTALREAVTARRRSVYRSPAEIDETATARHDGKPLWLAMFLPSESGDRSAPAMVTDAGGHERQSRRVLRRVPEIDAVCIGLYLPTPAIVAATLVLARTSASGPLFPSPVNSILVVLVPLILAAVIARPEVCRRSARARPLHEVMLDLGSADPAGLDASGGTSERVPEALEAAADLVAAERSYRAGAFGRALTLADRGVWRADRLEAEASRELLPELLALRARVLPLVGNPDESESELAALLKEFTELPTRALVQWQVKLRCALARGDHAGALAIAERYADFTPPMHDETLAVLVLAQADACPRDDLERIAATLAHDEEHRAWIDAAAPGLRTRARVVERPPRVRLDLTIDNDESASGLDDSETAEPRVRRRKDL